MVVVNYVMTAAMTAAFTRQMSAKTAMVAQEVGKLTSKPTVNPTHMMENRTRLVFLRNLIYPTIYSYGFLLPVL